MYPLYAHLGNAAAWPPGIGWHSCVRFARIWDGGNTPGCVSTLHAICSQGLGVF